ncbi:MAG: nicotinate (nicotinamide) nucleotide adenylyltransferase [Candidatus Omnitrophica bacterium]|nr:nicotinate (nicotinamide) nucleotide adenylyltransferase [Candidatus Omnitrophota bacterium]
MKIGILGGTFNPPHVGHLTIAQDILDSLGLDKVVFIPTNTSPHKNNNGVSGQIRLEMVKLATSGNKAFEVLDLEIERGGTSFTIDTVRELKKKYPEDEIYLIIGSDLANEFSSWKDHEDIKKEVKVVVANRKEYPLEKRTPYLVVDIRQIELSSSQIRELVKSQSSIKGLVKEAVESYIQERSLYKG